MVEVVEDLYYFSAANNLRSTAMHLLTVKGALLLELEEESGKDRPCPDLRCVGGSVS